MSKVSGPARAKKATELLRRSTTLEDRIVEPLTLLASFDECIDDGGVGEGGDVSELIAGAFGDFA